ncbi:TIGR02281 family clan AA aspartic protease [Phreatobacter sp.]|uniref:TIGR02281 family clan AA aspartic protease n=1 Tax=Phreatobacter sp. TaxID=1966341 RepID=UPI003F719413
MLPKSFYLLMLPLGAAAVMQPEAFTMLTAMVGAERAPQAQVATAPPARPEAASWPMRRIVSGQGGHFQVNARAEGRHLSMLVDTGATLVALTWETGLSLNLVRPGTPPNVEVRTANGNVRAWRVTLARLEVEGLAVSGVETMVMPAGALGTNLLGMSYLTRLRRFEFAQNSLVLEQ